MESLTHQTLSTDSYEIIVVDNNSTDATADIARKFGATVINEKRQGNTFALSKGLSYAQGKIIASTDADTVPDTNWLEIIKDTFKDEKVVGATGLIRVNSGNKILDYLSEKFYEYFLRLNFLIGKSYFSGFNFAVRKNALEKIGGVDERFTMSPDVDLGIRIRKEGNVVLVKNMLATTSLRRWQKKPVNTFWLYFESYIYSAWLRKPPRVTQKVVR